MGCTAYYGQPRAWWPAIPRLGLPSELLITILISAGLRSETDMKYHVQVTRLQVAERTVTAIDEERAIEKIRAELKQPFGFLGSWKDRDFDVKIVGVERPLGDVPNELGSGPMVYDLKTAAAQLGISRSTLYELVRTGQVEHIRIGRRVLLSHVALEKFIEQNTYKG